MKPQEPQSLAAKKRTVSTAPATTWITMSDIMISFSLPIIFCMSWFTRPRDWPRICRLLTPLVPKVLAQDKRLLYQHISTHVGQRELSSSVGEIVRDYYVAQIERKLLTLRMYRPGRWQPSIKLLGQEHIVSALRRGKGLVIWDSDFAFASLITKMALFQAGFGMSHLSHPSHGFDSSTKYAMLTLNPLIYSVEQRYLSARVVLSLAGSAMATRTLMRCLNGNGIVSITANDNSNNSLRLPFLDGTTDIAIGAPRLALKTGAALLPVFTLRDENGGFLVTVDREIDMPASGSSQERMQTAVRDYLERLTPYVERQPGQWRTWNER